MRISTQRLAAVSAIGLLALSPAPSDARDWKLNPGAFMDNYIPVVDPRSAFLVHPTGAHPAAAPKTRGKAGYLPSYHETDDMERTVLEMREAGYVMVGYSAVNTRKREEVQCDPKALDVNELAGCRMGAWFRRDNPDADPLGDPVDTAIWANAATVVLQENYSFSRGEIRKERIVTDEGQDTTKVQGATTGVYEQQSDSATTGTSQTKGTSTTAGDWDQAGVDARATVGGEGGGSLSAGGNLARGTYRSGTNYDQTGTFQSNTSTQTTGSSYQQHDQTVQHNTKHWATALIEKQVDHYDLMVTYWKKADPGKMIFGALTEPTPRELWTALRTRQARTVSAVIGGTPAYAAEIWEGDVILAINGEKIQGAQGLSDLLDRHRGQDVAVTLWREGQVFDIQVRLNNPT